MAGLYIHIPFCAKKCAYCDFYSIAFLGDRDLYIDALKRDISQRKSIIEGEALETIYFGGGTPSLCEPRQLQSIIEHAKGLFGSHNSLKEITIEVNPEDVTKEYIEKLQQSDINRVSIGVQSFSDEILSFMNRRHNSQRAIDAIKMLKESGYNNISLDLIYGVPSLSNSVWSKTIDRALDLDIEHISAYHLTIEEGTKFGRELKRGNFKAVDDTVTTDHYQILTEKLQKGRFTHYEISNFAKGEEHISRHNSSYWSGKPYLGVGSSSHSFDGKRRREWVINSVKEYIELTKGGDSYIEYETLDNIDLINEFIMLSLRCAMGISLTELERRTAAEPKMRSELLKKAEELISKSLLIECDNHLRVKERDFLISDYIITSLIF